MASASQRTAVRWLAIGSGSSGCLGLGTVDDYNVPTPLPTSSPLPSDPITQVACGGCHTLVLLSSGQVLACGSHAHGQLGPIDDDAEPPITSLTPWRMPAHLESVVLVACGWTHSLLVTSSGRLYAWGDNRRAQLGLPGDVSEVHSPQLVESLKDVEVVHGACGWRHSAVVARVDGVRRVYAWGAARKGQLGAGEGKQERVPVVMQCEVEPERVACGWEFTAVLDVHGGVWATGKNTHGQLGQGDCEQRSVLARVQGVDGVVQLDCGWSHCAVLTVSGQAYTWGRGDKGQLGIAEPALAVTSPQPVELEGVRQVACGAEHTVFVGATGRLFTCGWNEHGNLGHGHETNLATPTVVAKVQGVRTVATGGASVLLVCEDKS